MVGNGDVYNDDNQRIIDGTKDSSKTASEISTTLTITDVSFSHRSIKYFLSALAKKCAARHLSSVAIWTRLIPSCSNFFVSCYATTTHSCYVDCYWMAFGWAKIKVFNVVAGEMQSKYEWRLWHSRYVSCETVVMLLHRHWLMNKFWKYLLIKILFAVFALIKSVDYVIKALNISS